MNRLSRATCTRCRAVFDVSGFEPGAAFICGSCGAQLKLPDAPAPEEAAPVRSRLPLVLAACSVGVTAIALLLLVALPGDEAAGPAKLAADLETPAERMSRLENEVFSAHQSGDEERLRRVFEEATDLNAHATARRAAEFALKLDSGLIWAHRGLGHVPFTLEGLPSEAEFPTPDWEALRDAAEAGWVTPEEEVELTAARKRFLAHRERLASDAHYRNLWRARAAAAEHIVLRDYAFETLEAGPWLVFVQRTGVERKDRDAATRAARLATLLSTLYRTFRSKYGERVGLPELGEQELMRAWVFADQEAFKRYLATVEAPHGRPACAVYGPKTRWLAVSPAPYRGVANPPGQVLEDNFCLQEAAKQLLHHVRKRLLGEEHGRAVDWSDPRIWSKSHWLREGLAEYLGTARESDDTWELCQQNHYRIRSWRRLRTQLVKEWSLSELLEVRGTRDLEEAELENPWLASLFLSQSWAFVYFLQHGAEGKYEERFLTYLERELHGRTGPRVFQEAFGLDRVAGSELEADFYQWCGGILGS